MLGYNKVTVDEYDTYHYPEDKGLDLNSPEAPVDANNHNMSANMYFTQMTERFRKDAIPVFVPTETTRDRIIREQRQTAHSNLTVIE